jgi:hypothetical protein
LTQTIAPDTTTTAAAATAATTASSIAATVTDAATVAALAPLYHTALRAQLDLLSLVTDRNELDNYLLHGQHAANLGVALPVVHTSSSSASSAVHSGLVCNSIVGRRGARRDSAATGTATAEVSLALSPVLINVFASSSIATSAIRVIAVVTAAG